MRFEVVPGVTAGVAAPAYAGIPVTHRDEASAVAFVTGARGSGQGRERARLGGAGRVPRDARLLHGRAGAARVAAALIEHGRAAAEPAAVVERGTLPGQRTVTGPLEQIAAAAQEADIGPPAVTVVGPVAALRERLAWFERAPLHGRRVAVTRARAQASGLARRLEELGAEVVQVPAIRIEPRRPTACRRRSTSWARAGTTSCASRARTAPSCCSTRSTGRGSTRARWPAPGRRDRPGHRGRAARRGLAADVVPERSIAESLAAELVAQGVAGKRVLIARAAEARDVLPASSSRPARTWTWWRSTRPCASSSTSSGSSGSRRPTTSPSPARRRCGSCSRRSAEPSASRTGARVVSIGPVTSETARELGLEVHVEAERHDVDGLVDALLRDATRPRRRRRWPPACCRSRSCPTTGTATSGSASATA